MGCVDLPLVDNADQNPLAGPAPRPRRGHVGVDLCAARLLVQVPLIGIKRIVGLEWQPLPPGGAACRGCCDGESERKATHAESPRRREEVKAWIVIETSRQWAVGARS